MPVRVGLWGATGSGKTTFLAALAMATFRSRDRYGRWDVRGADLESEEFLNASTAALLEGEFPPSHLNAVGYRWHVWGSPPRRSWARERVSRKVRFDLEVLDVPGGTFDTGYSVGNDDWHKVLDHFAGCDGLIYLHDPCRDDNGNFMLGAVQRLVGEVGRRDGLDRGRLPHHLAVCVAKFDDPEVFARAREQGWMRQETPFSMPEPSDAKAYYESLAEDMVVHNIAAYFAPKRTSYYATSAVGFRARPDGRVDPSECANVVQEGDQRRIVGKVHPVNVLESLTWLAQQARQRRTSAPAPETRS